MLGGQELGLSSFNALRCVNLDLKDTEDTSNFEGKGNRDYWSYTRAPL